MDKHEGSSSAGSPAVYISEIKMPPAAPETTTVHGGSYQNASMENSTAASAKSTGCVMEAVQIGVYNAQIRMPTTAAITHMIAPMTILLLRRLSQNGRAPKRSRNADRKFTVGTKGGPCQ